MTDQEIKDLLKKSIIPTSVDFTDQLMHKIARQEQKVPAITFPYMVVGLICLLLTGAILLGYLLPHINGNMTNSQITLIKRGLQIGITLFLLFSLDQLIHLKKAKPTLRVANQQEQ